MSQEEGGAIIFMHSKINHLIVKFNSSLIMQVIYQLNDVYEKISIDDNGLILIDIDSILPDLKFDFQLNPL